MADDKKNGYIYLDRSIQESRLWKKRPFSKGQAWIDLILLANYKDTKMPYKDGIITCKRGTVNLSVESLAEKWGWDRKTVRKFLKQLQANGSVEYRPSKYRTTILIVNYNSYQNKGKGTTKSHDSSEVSQNEGQHYGQRNIQKSQKSGQRNGQQNIQNLQKDGQRSGQRYPTSALGSDETVDNEVDNTMDNTMDNAMDNTMDNAMDITKESKGRLSKVKERKEKDDFLFKKYGGSLTREQWDSGIRIAGLIPEEAGANGEYDYDI